MATGLHGLLRNHAFALLQQLFCQYAGGDGFADVRGYMTLAAAIPSQKMMKIQTLLFQHY